MTYKNFGKPQVEIKLFIRKNCKTCLHLVSITLKLSKVMLYTPLEQFQIILLFSIKLFCFDFSITNLALVNFLVLLFFSAMVILFSSNANSLKETSLFISL